MAQIYYQINSGYPNFTAHIEPNVAPDQIHSSTGIYSFDDIPAGNYSITVTDSIGCEAFFDNIVITTTTTTTMIPMYNCGDTATYIGGYDYPNEVRFALGEQLGEVVLGYNTTGIPDRFIISFDGSIVADSGYRGDVEYDFGNSFRGQFTSSLTGKEDPITNTIYPDFLNFPDDGYPRILGTPNGSVSFYKSTTTNLCYVYIYSPMENTAWVFDLYCPTPTTTTTTTSIPLSSIIISASANGDGASMNYITGAAQQQSQTFTVGDITLKKISMRFAPYTGSPNFNVRCSIYTESSDVPVSKLFDSQNVIFCTAGYNPGNINENTAEFIFDNALSSGKYAFVMSYEDVITHNTTNYIGFAFNSASAYAGGKYKYFYNGSWSPWELGDMKATIYYL